MSWKHGAVAWGACVASLFASRSARAYRPFDSTDASVAAPGEFELEAGPVGYLRARQLSYLVAPAIVANLGFYDRWEVVLQGRELVLLKPGEAHPGWSDSEVSLKAVLREGSLQGGSGISSASELGLLLPTPGDAGLGFSGSLLLSQRWSFATLHINLEGERTRAGNPDVFVGTIIEGPFAWPVRPVAEALFEQEFAGERMASGLVGLIGRAHERLAVDAAVRLGRVGDLAVFEVRAGLTWTLRIWGEQPE